MENALLEENNEERQIISQGVRLQHKKVEFCPYLDSCTTLLMRKMKEGQAVMAWLSAANFDETYFSHAEQFDIRRSPNPHLTFGHGIHYCLGAPLARLETKIALERIAASWSEIHDDPDHPPVYVSPGVDLLRSYPIFFTPVHA